MATSYIGYQAKGFWCSDIDLEVWLSFAVRELAALKLPEPWLRQLHHHWSFYAQAGLSGAIDLELDHFLPTAQHRTQLLALVQAVQQRFRALGDTVSKEWLNPLMPKGTQWVEDPPTLFFLTVGERLTQLLEGRLLTDAASPLDYL